MKASMASAPLVLAVFLVPIATLGQYRWPLDPGQGPHGIHGTLAECRPTPGRPHFHEGVDMEADAEDPVKLVQRGTVTWMQGEFLEIDGDAWVYTHVHNQRRYVDRWIEYPAGHHAADVRRMVDPHTHEEITHLHFEEQGGRQNPLLRGHLQGAPEFDTLWPRVIDMWFQEDNSAECLPEEDDITVVRGKVDIVSRAQDAMPLPGSPRVGLYRMWYRMRDRNLGLVEDEVSFRFDRVPPPQDFWHVYQRRITFADGSRDWSTKSKYYYIATYKHGSEFNYWNTKQREGAPEEVDAGSIDEAKYPDNLYRVAVLAWDAAEHGGDEEDARGADTAWVAVDNFLPELRDLTIKQGRRVIYNSDHPNNPDSSYGFAQPGFPLDFTVCFSEGMPTDSPPIVTYGPPNDADTVTTVGWDTTRTPCDTWIGTAVPDYSLEGDHQVHILAWDLVGNELDTLAGAFTILLEIYVADFWSDWPLFVNRIQVFDWYGSFRRQFTFEDPYHLAEVCVDKAGYCYVSGTCMAIHKFDRVGNSCGELELSPPWYWARGITADNAFVYAMAEGPGDLTKVHKLTTGLSFWDEWDTEHGDYTPTLEYSSWSDRLFVLLRDRDYKGWAELYDTTGVPLKVVEIEGGDQHSAQPAADTDGIYITTDNNVIQKHDFEMNEVDDFEYWEQVVNAMAADNLHLYVTGWPDPPFVGVINKGTRDTVRCFGEKGTSPGHFKNICGIALFPPLPGPQEMVPEASAPLKGKSAAQSVQKVTVVPNAPALVQNHPNPCQEFTTIDYQLPKSSHAKLKIYDVSGRLVRTLVDEESHAGAHSTKWDLKADNGCRVVHGVYFYRITAGDFTATKKMVVLR